MNDYLTKPIRVDELVAAIERTPRRELATDEPKEAASHDTIDERALTRLVDGTGGDAGFVAELIDQFMAEAPELVAVARAGLEAGDADEVRRAAHTLKSNAATFGAHHLAERSRGLEEAAKHRALEDGSRQLAGIAGELDLVREALPAAWRTMSSR